MVYVALAYYGYSRFTLSLPRRLRRARRVPVGMVGPVAVRGDFADRDDYLVPMATTEAGRDWRSMLAFRPLVS